LLEREGNAESLALSTGRSKASLFSLNREPNMLRKLRKISNTHV